MLRIKDLVVTIHNLALSDQLMYTCKYVCFQLLLLVSVLPQPSCSSNYTVSSNLQYVYVNQEASCIACSLPGGVTPYSWTINNSSAVGQTGAHLLFNGSLLIQDPLSLLVDPRGVLTVQCYDQTQLVSYMAYVTLGGEYFCVCMCICLSVLCVGVCVCVCAYVCMCVFHVCTFTIADTDA